MDVSLGMYTTSLEIEVIKNDNNKSCSPFFIFFNEKKFEKDSGNFWRRKNDFKSQNFAVFDLQS